MNPQKSTDLSQYPQLRFGDKCINSGLGTDQLTSFSFYAAAPRMHRQLCCDMRRSLSDFNFGIKHISRKI